MLDARFVVDATGRQGSFATSQGVRRTVHDRLAAVFAFFRLRSDGVADTYTLVEACEHGWWYSALLPRARMIVAFLSDTDLIRGLGVSERGRWLEQLERAPHTARRVEHAEPTELGRHGARSQRLECMTGNGWLATGDAAATLDPLSSQGILNALRWGILASHAIRDHLHGIGAALPLYERLVASDYEDYLDARAAYYEREDRWPDAPFWQRRREAITLDPGATLATCPPRAGGPARLRGLLEAAELELLRDLCSPPRAAHEVVAVFNARRGRSVADRRVVLALQDLVRRGLMTTSPSGRSWRAGGGP
jgi:flavin-dependent dehydrogenase